MAQIVGTHDTVGIDLVAMCVNDVICCGAEPLFFLDYVAMSHDDPALLEPVVAGISDGGNSLSGSWFGSSVAETRSPRGGVRGKPVDQRAVAANSHLLAKR